MEKHDVIIQCGDPSQHHSQQGFSQPAKEYEEKLLDVGTKVRYLYELGELEGYQYKGERRK